MIKELVSFFDSNVRPADSSSTRLRLRKLAQNLRDDAIDAPRNAGDAEKMRRILMDRWNEASKRRTP